MKRRGVAPTVVAEGGPNGWGWVLEGWGAAQAPYRVFLQMRSSAEAVPVGDLPIAPRFAQAAESDANVLFGPVADEVESVIVKPVYPVRAPAKRADIRSTEEFGRFFVVAFDEPVEMARVEIEPAARFAATFALNMELRARRQNAEAIELGRGSTTDGRRWRLCAWRERPQMPDLLTVDLTVAGDDHEIEGIHETGMSSSYGGPPMPAAEVMTPRMIGRNSREQHIVGELIPAVAQVKVLLDDTTEFDAQLVRSAVVENDYFVAFVRRPRQAVELVALDQDQRVLARQSLDDKPLGENLRS